MTTMAQAIAEGTSPGVGVGAGFPAARRTPLHSEGRVSQSSQIMARERSRIWKRVTRRVWMAASTSIEGSGLVQLGRAERPGIHPDEGPNAFQRPADDPGSAGADRLGTSREISRARGFGESARRRQDSPVSRRVESDGQGLEGCPTALRHSGSQR